MKNNKIQIIRAILALFVVLIHALPNNTELRIILRSILNISVAGFIFLSGFLTKLDVETKAFYKKRVLTVLVPYLIFSVLYSIPEIMHLNLPDSLELLVKNIITSEGKYHLYYLVVYIQLVLIAPLLARIAKQKSKILDMIVFLIQPLFIACLYLGILGESIIKVSPWYGIVFPAWLSYYYLGLVVGNRAKSVKASGVLLLATFMLSSIFQIAEGFIWKEGGAISDIYYSQLRITALVQNILGVLLLAKIAMSKKRITARLLERVGNASFGIYLLHPALIMLCDKILVRTEATFVVTFVVAFAGSFATVLVLNKIVPRKALKYTGLAIK